jgi:exodeoxyribonuclease V gamma subunit
MPVTLRHVDGATQDHGLVIYRASRLEDLLEAMVPLLEATKPEHILTPQTIIAAHPGMRRWMTDALARKAGLQGIAANLDILLMSTWIDRVAQEQLGGQHAIGLQAYRRQNLRWAIHAILSQDKAALQVMGLNDPWVMNYLQQGGASQPQATAAQRGFQLAERLADLYVTYMIYRPDWLVAWQSGHFQVVTGAGTAPMSAIECMLLAPLWREVQARLGLHRGSVMADLTARLATRPHSASQEALHVFGLTHLAPTERDLLRAHARHGLVALYVPDPCREYWGGLKGDLPSMQQALREEQARIEASCGNDYWVEQGHALLARWGRLGQHFIMTLLAEEGDVLYDVRHWRDSHDAAPANRLDRLQQSIRELDMTLLREDPCDQGARHDASLLVHVCTTPLRELEVLRDQILEAMAQAEAGGQPLEPGEIVVMSPDIEIYEPLIPAVFGRSAGDVTEEASSSHRHTPHSLVDTPSNHPLLVAFLQLLELPGSRLTAAQVADLLAVSEVALRLRLDGDQLDQLLVWLRRSRVAWGLDGAFKRRFGVPPIAEHTLGWALDRLLAGHLMADAATDERQEAVSLADGSEVLPLTAIQGPSARALGALQELLTHIHAFCALAEQIQPMAAWATELERLFLALFRVNPGDREARKVYRLVLDAITDLALEPQRAQVDPSAQRLHFAVVRDLLRSRLAEMPARQVMALGRITFCGLVPQRAIPFRFVAVLGLNELAFPRQKSDGGLDLMARYPRLGDRQGRSDDRYLFLETVMAARERLHLSYLGENERDGTARNPASPLAELLAALDAAAGLRFDDPAQRRPWCVRHPLQPFDERYFRVGDQADPRLFSFQGRFAAMHGPAGHSAVAPFLDPIQHGAPNAAQQASLSGTVALNELHAYYRDPARYILQHHLHLRLDALDDAGEFATDEPIEPDFDAIDTVPRRLFFNEALPVILDGQAWPPAEPLAWLRLSGLLPPGRPGQLAWIKACEAVVNLVRQVETHVPWFMTRRPVVQQMAMDWRCNDLRLLGQIPHVYELIDEAGQTMWLVMRAFPGKDEEDEINFKDRVSMFLDWALLRLQNGAGRPVRLWPILEEAAGGTWSAGLNAWDERFLKAGSEGKERMLTDLQARVRRLVMWWQEAADHPLRYFPKTSWEVLQPKGKPIDVWQGNEYATGERDYAPGYTHLLAVALDLHDAGTMIVLRNFASMLRDTITLFPEHA